MYLIFGWNANQLQFMHPSTVYSNEVLYLCSVVHVVVKVKDLMHHMQPVISAGTSDLVRLVVVEVVGWIVDQAIWV